MRFDIFNRSMVEQYNATEKHIVISLRNPKSDKPKLSASCKETRLDTLCLEVADTEASNRVLFTSGMATKIWSFVNFYKDKMDLIVVHCETGSTISPAVGSALSKVLNGNDEDFFSYFTPNTYIYNKVLAIKK